MIWGDQKSDRARIQMDAIATVSIHLRMATIPSRSIRAARFPDDQGLGKGIDRHGGA
jgi:hypothetical protein